MRYIFGFCFLIAVTTRLSCNKNRIEAPAVILEDSILVNILADSYILNSAFNQTYGIVKDSIGQVYSQQILDKYEISQELLESNILWMYQEPQRMDTIFPGNAGSPRLSRRKDFRRGVGTLNLST